MGCCLSTRKKEEKKIDQTPPSNGAENPNIDEVINFQTGNFGELFVLNDQNFQELKHSKSENLNKSYQESKLNKMIQETYESEKTLAITLITDEDELLRCNYTNILNKRTSKDIETNLILPTENKCFDYSIDTGIDEYWHDEPEQKINITNLNNTNYFSINSTSIVGNNKFNEDLALDERKISNIFTKKQFIFLYFEINYFIFCARDYLMSLYPELNLIMLIEVNDSKLTGEKVFFTRSNEDVNKYFPMKTKCDTMLDPKLESYRILQAFDTTEMEENDPFKISINFYTYTNHKLIAICSDVIFLTLNHDGELQKYKMYQNIFMKHYNKKIGNLYFNYAYKKEELYPIDIEEAKTRIKHEFKYLQSFSKFEENSDLPFVYNKIDNSLIKENGNQDYSKYFSLEEICDVQTSEELKGDVKLDRLLELLSIVKRKYEFFQILKKFNNCFTTKEFVDNKLNNFKELIYTRVSEFAEKKDLSEIIIIPYIFALLKKVFFKMKTSNGNRDRRRKSTPSLKNLIAITEESKKNEDFLKIKNSELLIKYFYISFSFLRNDIHEDISLSALNFIFKYLEEALIFHVNGKVTTTDEYFFELLIEKKLYEKFIDMLFKYYEYQACVQPIFIILSKVIRIKKTKCKDLTNLFMSEKFTDILRKIIRIHDCNSAVMSNLFLCLSTLAEATDINLVKNVVSIQRLKEIFKIFKMSGFDIVHDTIFSLIKLIITKKTDKPKIEKKQTQETLVINSDETSDLTDEDYQDVIMIFSNLLFFIRNKILMLDFFKLTKWLNSFLTHLYTVSHLINNFPVEVLRKFSNLLTEKKIAEFMIDCFNVIADKKVFSGLDTAFPAFDTNLLKTKITIFRAIHHSLGLIKNLKELNPSNLTKNGAEKMLRIIKVLESSDIIYNPKNLLESINCRLKSKTDPETQTLLMFHKNLQDYYTRYKNKAPDHIKELMQVVKK